jgi:hypothetical protein
VASESKKRPSHLLRKPSRKLTSGGLNTTRIPRVVFTAHKVRAVHSRGLVPPHYDHFSTPTLSFRAYHQPDTQLRHQFNMSAARSLKDLPAHLRRYAATRLSTPPPADEKCAVCWRPYNTVDEAEPAERPCHAEQLAPCGHFIGSECLRELLRREYRKEITSTPALVRYWIAHLLRRSSWILSTCTCSVRRSFTEASAARFKHLHERPFSGTLDPKVGLELWALLMKWPLERTVAVACMMFGLSATFHVLEKALTALYGRPHDKLTPYLLSLLGHDMNFFVSTLNVLFFSLLGLMLLDASQKPDAMFWAGVVFVGVAIRNPVSYCA